MAVFFQIDKSATASSESLSKGGLARQRADGNVAWLLFGGNEEDHRQDAVTSFNTFPVNEGAAEVWSTPGFHLLVICNQPYAGITVSLPS